jgi:hypothetical protein
MADTDGATTTQGVFAAGNITDNSYKQAVISAAQGASAELSAYNYIQRIKGLGESNLGKQYQSIGPSYATSAAVLVLPITPYPLIGL